MRAARVVLAIAILVGIVWMGQGIGLIRGSFMTGRIEWSVIGALLSGVSVVVLLLTTRGSRA